jgi:predicted MFS family arabinose efflux permease/quinol monooxygenase YgiN
VTATAEPKAVTSASASPFAPFRHGAYALLWTATLLSNIGTWMHDVAAAWLMTSLAPSPFFVALVQAATTAAMALFALPAGAMADLFDRKRLLISLKLISGSLAFLLATLTWSGLTTPALLLTITFLMGITAALVAPVWQAIVPSLVPREVLPQAVAMNSMGINVARAIGPAIGGAIVVAAGAAWAFAVNGVSELVIIAALLLWKPRAAPRKPHGERFLPAIVAGLRYAGASPDLRTILLRAAAFFLFASAFWALLPVLVRGPMGGAATHYGAMVSAVGAGAVLGALSMPVLSRLLGGGDALVRAGSIGMAVVLVLLAAFPSTWAGLAAAVLAGLAWILVLSSLNVAAQNALPDWVRGRGLSIYGLAFFGSMTVGALGWGVLAEAAGVRAALAVAGIGLVAALLGVRGWQLPAGGADLAPGGLWPEPAVSAAFDDTGGPVMVTVEYRIAPDDRAAFLAAIQMLEGERRRNGAYAWGVFEDAADPGRFVESFEEASWSEHLRHHARVTKADADIDARVKAFHQGEGPLVRHLIAAERR